MIESGHRWRVAIIDSGLDPAAGLPVLAQGRLDEEAGRIAQQEAVDDASGHGTRVARVIASASRPPALLIAQVLDAKGRATPAGVAAALRWACDQDARIIHLSLGLAADRAVLAQAVSDAIGAGVVVVASAPARGAMSWPARYPGVLSATGDARCAPDQISALGEQGAKFGGCVLRPPGRQEPRGGASIGAAHVTRFIVSHVRPGSTPAQVRSDLVARASFHGRERRSG